VWPPRGFGGATNLMTRLRKRAEFLGVVPAAEERAADKAAIEAFALDERTAADGLRRREDERGWNAGLIAGVSTMPTSASRASRRKNAGSRQKLCSRCSVRLARHQVNGDRLCCHCYVGRGYPPAEWHPECLAAASASKKARP